MRVTSADDGYRNLLHPVGVMMLTGAFRCRRPTTFPKPAASAR
ncbi:hypothetical protein LEUCIP111803_02448 [Leucobacter soli]|jgi:hypothetical protein|uniref:Uncharacterized protein n=1 Tax=Leucobacter soli TaxID=2812850 RepID=A0A916K184_9MICO|nr:hypothetical protein LEUCIP111803_02448 [Leucobacter soli]